MKVLNFKTTRKSIEQTKQQQQAKKQQQKQQKQKQKQQQQQEQKRQVGEEKKQKVKQQQQKQKEKQQQQQQQQKEKQKQQQQQKGRQLSVYHHYPGHQRRRPSHTHASFQPDIEHQHPKGLQLSVYRRHGSQPRRHTRTHASFQKEQKTESQKLLQQTVILANKKDELSLNIPYFSTFGNAMKYYFGIDWEENWKVIENKGSGDCLYLSIQQALGESIDNTIQNMRNLVAESIDDDLYSQIWSYLNDNEKAPLKQRIKKYAWADNSVIEVLSKKYNFIPIIIYAVTSQLFTTPGCDGYINYKHIISNKIGPSDRFILLKFNGINHYELIEKTKPTKKKLLRHTDIPEKLLINFKKACRVRKQSSPAPHGMTTQQIRQYNKKNREEKNQRKKKIENLDKKIKVFRSKLDSMDFAKT